MIQLNITITALSPLCFSERRPGGQFRFSLDYVPGAVLRGAAAAIMLRAGNEHDPGFQRLFGVGQPPVALFRCAYPGAYVLPHTALSCKDTPGFAGQTETAHGHGVFDTLIDRLCFEQLQPPGLLYPMHCPQPDCDPGRVEAFTGFYNVEGRQYHSRSVPQRLLTRVGLNRQRMAAEDALLYAPMVLSEAWWRDNTIERARFQGTVWVEDALAQPLAETLHQVKHLGSGSARGLGQVQVECAPETASSDQTARIQAVRQRVAHLNSALHEQWERVRGLCDGEPQSCPQVFTVNLRADAILKEHGWLPTTALTPQMLRDATGVADLSLRLLRAYTSYDYRGGWNTGQRLPKDTELVTRLGSVFVFQTDDITRWHGPLADLEVSGLGERTAEGFGEVCICDAFHVVAGREPK